VRKLLSGNEAIALGAWEAGVAVGCGYPGTPSTEILEALSDYPGLYTEWSVNEKVALEVGLGASLAGGRSLVTMKHVGVNVAADPLFTSAYTGINAGLVVVTADDPAMHSSQNEQDNRNYAVAAKLPMFEPSTPAEAREFTRQAFELSEGHDTPCFLRTTTRLSHSKGVVDDVDLTISPAKHPIGFDRDPAKYVMIPGNAKRRRVVLEARLEELRRVVETHPANRIEPGRRSVGIITSGVPYTYVREVMPHASVLKLGIVNPLPRGLIEEFAASVETLYVVEELDPVIETQIRAWGIDCHGKDTFPTIGEFSPEVLRAAFGLPARTSVPGGDIQVPARLPGLCAGCPHGHVFTILRDKGILVAGDIGCYSLGVLPPYSVMDTCIDMGASITVAHGMDAVFAQADGPRTKVAAVIGDSTFAHSGITGLLNAVWNKRDGLYIVLDNGTTAMTGTQPNPLSGERMGRENTTSVSYELLARAIGIPDANVAVVDGNDSVAITAAIDDLLERDGVKLLAAVGLCVIEAKELRKLGKLDEKKRWRELEITPISDATCSAISREDRDDV
jgi:indolepyruvate ferredoxin oxidoreductase alpha subunit